MRCRNYYVFLTITQWRQGAVLFVLHSEKHRSIFGRIKGECVTGMRAITTIKLRLVLF